MEVRAARLGIQARMRGARVMRGAACCGLCARVLTQREWPRARRAAAVVTGVLSLAVTLAEVTVSPGLPNMSVFAYALHAMPTHESATELLAFAFLVRPTPAPTSVPRHLHAAWVERHSDLPARVRRRTPFCAHTMPCTSSGASASTCWCLATPAPFRSWPMPASPAALLRRLHCAPCQPGSRMVRSVLCSAAERHA